MFAVSENVVQNPGNDEVEATSTTHDEIKVRIQRLKNDKTTDCCNLYTEFSKLVECML